MRVVIVSLVLVLVWYKEPVLRCNEWIHEIVLVGLVACMLGTCAWVATAPRKRKKGVPTEHTQGHGCMPLATPGLLCTLYVFHTTMSPVVCSYWQRTLHCSYFFSIIPFKCLERIAGWNQCARWNHCVRQYTSNLKHHWVRACFEARPRLSKQRAHPLNTCVYTNVYMVEVRHAGRHRDRV